MTSETRASVLNAITLPDDGAYFALDATAVEALTKRVAGLLQPPPMSRPPGVARQSLPELRLISAPGQVDWRTRSSFPLLVAEVRSNQREWEVASRQNRYAIVSNLSTGSVNVVTASDKGRRMPALPPSRSEPAPDAFNARLSSIDVERHDILLWMPREWLQGRLALTLLDHDLPSNTVQVQATAGPAASEQAGAPHAMAAGQNRLMVTPGGGGALPAVGVAGVMLEPSTEASTRGGPRFKAAFKLQRPQVTLFQSGEGASRRLLTTASLVLVQLDRAAPLVLNLAVPVEANAAEAALQASFNLDLSSSLTVQAAPHGIWQAYLVVGSMVAGPVKVSLGAH